jgi:hypothetical protein
MAMQGDPEPAKQLAERMLTSAVLPAGLTAANDPPPTPGPGAGIPATPNVVDTFEIWTSSDTLGSLTDFLLTHPPTGMACPSASEISTTRQVEGRAMSDTNAIVIGFRNTDPTPNGIQSANLSYVVAPISTTTTVVRVDAVVVFQPPRNLAATVPSHDLVVTVTRSGTTKDTVTITDAAATRQLAEILNGLPTWVPGIYSAPPSSESYTVAFATAIGTPPDFTVVENNGYARVSITATGVNQTPDLYDPAGQFIQALNRLIPSSLGTTNP